MGVNDRPYFRKRLGSVTFPTIQRANMTHENVSYVALIACLHCVSSVVYVRLCVPCGCACCDVLHVHLHVCLCVCVLICMCVC